MRTLIALTMVLTASVANAQQISVSRGLGVGSCSQFVKEYEASTDVENHYFSWGQGLMTGLNLSLAQANRKGNSTIARNLSFWSTDEQKHFVRSYCDEHPLQLYMDAIVDLYQNFPTRPTTIR